MNEIKETMCEKVRQAIVCGDCMTNSYLEHLKMCKECKKFYREQNELSELLMSTHVPGIAPGSIADAVMQTVTSQNKAKSVKAKRIYWRNYIGTAAAAVIILVVVVSSKILPVLDPQNSLSKEQDPVTVEKDSTASISDIQTKIAAYDKNAKAMVDSENSANQSLSEGVILDANPIETEDESASDIMRDLAKASSGGGSSASPEANASLQEDLAGTQDITENAQQEAVKEKEQEITEDSVEIEAQDNQEALSVLGGSDNYYSAFIKYFGKYMFNMPKTISQAVEIGNEFVAQNYSEQVNIDPNDERLSNITVEQFVAWAKTLTSFEQYNIDSLLQYVAK